MMTWAIGKGSAIADAISILRATRDHLVEHPELWRAGPMTDGGCVCLMVRLKTFSRERAPSSCRLAADTLNTAALSHFREHVALGRQLVPAAQVNDALGREAAIALCDHAIAKLEAGGAA